MRPALGIACSNVGFDGQTVRVVADSEVVAAAAELRTADLDPGLAFAMFDQQDSGCVSFGIEVAGRSWFVKSAITRDAAASLANAVEVHERCRHRAIVSPVRVFKEPKLTLVYPWRHGTVLNHATIAGSDRGALERFRHLPVDVIERAVGVVLDAHVEIAACGLVAVDFYDGCLLHDFDNDEIWLIDLDDYRPGPFVVDADRLPGSTSYMAPEEFARGAVIDERTTVFNLGRMLHHLLTSDDGWRGTIQQRSVVEVATAMDPVQRHSSVAALFDEWTRATSNSHPTR